MSRVRPPHRRIYVTDCEGPLSRNDNAQELAERFIPDGAAFFARLSRYDDFLADVEHRADYNAGDTLRLLAPFLCAYGARDGEVVSFSAEHILLVPGARQLLTELQSQLPTFIVSTSYTPYIRALCDVVGFPFDNCRCTTLVLDNWSMDDEEAAWLKDWAARVGERPLITIPRGATGRADLSATDRETVASLDRLFWTEMPERLSGEILAAVRPVGGHMKLAALREIVAQTGCRGREVMYVGDSITDAPALAAVKAWGGVALSFNGNAYALAAAEYAAAAADVVPVQALARAFIGGGAHAVREAVLRWPASAAGIVGVVEDQRELLTAASLAARGSVRGERVAALG